MNPSMDKTIFYAQHKNKCYCQNRNLCYCIGTEKASKAPSTSSHQFIKVRSDKSKPTISTSLRSTSSFSPVPTLRSSSSMTTTTESKLTDRRELYERSNIERMDSNNKFNVLTWNIQEQILFPGADLFNDERIARLQEFRMKNAQECLGSCKRYRVDDKKKEVISEETPKYTLNNRGLLTAVGCNDDGKAAIVSSKAAINDIIRQKINASKNKEKLVSKAIYHPENSLALRHQKTY